MRVGRLDIVTADVCRGVEVNSRSVNTIDNRVIFNRERTRDQIKGRDTDPAGSAVTVDINRNRFVLPLTGLVITVIRLR